ncbi:MAG: chemotaxis protein CheY [Paenibacillus sp.]|jgi:DNA-binding NarL/FixJ family response regulator|uniref:Response regulator transcription factor n=1 Tax=Paenibacillus hemerocallicola TaxID=1172614 RepID=A0A5C4T996_9BACL|nr:response regulator transcription factor [Paenibacillus hemerocallicola]MDF2662593.1 chemotaxis protein CheY [Paenibacillus sp.]TNJ64987.1 response regulator transcription factor [Paenibacillus hemerocallicola]
MTPYRVLIADDHPLARKAIRSLLDEDALFETIGEASRGEEAVALCGNLQPDLVLMDINMPDISGLEATRRIKQLHPHIRIVMLTVSDHVADLFTAIQFGAQGYLLKNMDPDDWMHYLRALLDDNSAVSRQMADKLFQHFRGGGTGASPSEPDSSVLTPRERELIACVAAGDTNRQIAERLVIAENTVKNHIKNILDKLNLENRVQLTAYAVRQGLTHIGQKRGEK